MQIMIADQQIENLKHTHRLTVEHNHAALLEHLRLMRENVTLVPGADFKSYPDGWKAAIDEVMKNIPIP
jgi:hypothetical protein